MSNSSKSSELQLKQNSIETYASFQKFSIHSFYQLGNEIVEDIKRKIRIKIYAIIPLKERVLSFKVQW
jgi:hypothetical protein